MTDLKVGLAGAGHIAAAHLSAWRRAPGCGLHGIFDLDATAAERRARSFRVERVFTRLEELIEACDVIDVCTPPATHAEIARSVLAAGRHLLIEKPLVTSLADWEALSEILRGTSARLGVLHNLKFTRGIRQARKWLQDGRIGRLLHLHRLFLTHPSRDRMLVEQHWSHGRPGGRWFETLPHELYRIHDRAGPLDLQQVTALQTPEAPDGAPADEVAIALAGVDRLATIRYSANCRLNKRLLFLYGSDGVITLDLLSGSLSLTRLRDRRWQRPAGGIAETASRLARWPLDRAGYLADRLGRRTPHALLISRFAEYLRDRGPSPTPIEEIDYVVRNAERIGREIDRQLEQSS